MRNKKRKWVIFASALIHIGAAFLIWSSEIPIANQYGFSIICIGTSTLIITILDDE